MGIVIEGVEFETGLGSRLLKARNGDRPVKGMESVWRDIGPITFAEAMESCPNPIKRRIAFSCLGVERLLREEPPILLDRNILNLGPRSRDTRSRVPPERYRETYSLYRVCGKRIHDRRTPYRGFRDDLFFVEIKENRSNTEHRVWIDMNRCVWSKNRKRYDLTSVDLLDAIASTIMTPVDESHITCILRKGGLFLVRYRLPEDEGFLQSTVPLSKETFITRLLPEM